MLTVIRPNPIDGLTSISTLGGSDTLTNKGWVGGVLGARVGILQTGLKFGAEWQFTTRSSIGGQISYAF